MSLRGSIGERSNLLYRFVGDCHAAGACAERSEGRLAMTTVQVQAKQLPKNAERHNVHFRFLAF